MRQCMIVDDSRIVRKVTRRILEELDLTVSEAEDGASALEMCRREMPDAILLDGHVPSVPAAEFLRILRRESGGDKPFVILCTIENELAQLTEAANAGANDYLLKPYDREILQAKLSEVGLVG